MRRFCCRWMGLWVGFSLLGVTTRVLTPNGDGLNDVVVFKLANPSDAGIRGRVFDLFGGEVASLRLRSDGHVEWDGKSSGRAVAGGLYVYQIEAEEQVFHGMVVVIR
ncbi:MAG: gliding motility-associated C-terminal domain-containing protein [Elusimicrobia bacterium]|nr:gliding motility-associated C-terminal domain-containing protein [Elusimicrobiota bacterium]